MSEYNEIRAIYYTDLYLKIFREIKLYLENIRGVDSEEIEIIEIFKDNTLDNIREILFVCFPDEKCRDTISSYIEKRNFKRYTKDILPNTTYSKDGILKISRNLTDIFIKKFAEFCEDYYLKYYYKKVKISIFSSYI